MFTRWSIKNLIANIKIPYNFSRELIKEIKSKAEAEILSHIEYNKREMARLGLRRIN